MKEVGGNYYVGRKINADSSNSKVLRATGPLRSSRLCYDDTLSEISELAEISQADSTQTVPANSSLSSFADVNRTKQDAPSGLRKKRYSRSKTMISIDPMAELHENQSSEHDFLNLSEELSAVSVLFACI